MLAGRDNSPQCSAKPNFWRGVMAGNNVSAGWPIDGYFGSLQLASSQRENAVPKAPPITCPPMKSGTLSGDIPAKVSVMARASVTAGLANEVEEVNQYAL